MSISSNNNPYKMGTSMMEEVTLEKEDKEIGNDQALSVSQMGWNHSESTGRL